MPTKTVKPLEGLMVASRDRQTHPLFVRHVFPLIFRTRLSSACFLGGEYCSSNRRTCEGWVPGYRPANLLSVETTVASVDQEGLLF